jgi:hypothetical protein
MTDEVERLITMIDLLDRERIHLIAEAWRERGYPHANWATIAAKRAGAERHNQACDAMRAMSTGVGLFTILVDVDQVEADAATWAARNAGMAMATEDLMGSLGYSSHEYARLIEPWFAGFADQELKEREEQ